jgi:hypothetical protein
MNELITCPKCQTNNAARAIHCIFCGYPLREEFGTSPSMTHFLTNPDQDLVQSLKQRKAYFSRDARLELRVTTTNEMIHCDLSASRITLGRKPTQNEIPHVDLSRFNAKEQGVSRSHARLTRMHAVIVLEDLGALNGTQVNGERISPLKPCVLCQGDMIRLGNLELEVIYLREVSHV